MDPEKIAKQPIAGDNPAGMDVSYEPEFEQIQAEIDKLSSPTASGQVDWNKVAQLGQTILAEKSKDLKVAGYLAVALMHTGKIDGLADGLTVMRVLLEEFWDTLWPKKKRMRGRLGALNWWLEKAQEQLEKLSNTTIEAEKISAMKENLAKIDEILADKMPDPPLVRPLIRLVETLPVKQEKKPEPEPPPAAEAQAPPAAKPAARPAPKPAAPAEPEKIATEKDARKAVNSALQKIQQAAGFLLENDLSDPAAYALRRIACWSRVVDLPPATEGRTQIPAPPPQVSQELEQLQADGKWEALVIACEKRLSQFIFWFDLNRMAAEALAAMGGKYQAASDTICQQAAFLAARLEGIKDLAFADGTAFADAQTKAWLQESGLAAGPATGTATGVAEQANDSEAEVLDEARKLIKKRKLSQAMQLIQEQIIQSFGLRQQFRWRLVVAKLLLEAKKAKLARPQLEKILATIERFHLEDWEPALALEGLSLALAGFKATADKEIRARCDDLLMRIAAIDPAAAVAAA